MAQGAAVPNVSLPVPANSNTNGTAVANETASVEVATGLWCWWWGRRILGKLVVCLRNVGGGNCYQLLSRSEKTHPQVYPLTKIEEFIMVYYLELLVNVSSSIAACLPPQPADCIFFQYGKGI